MNILNRKADELALKDAVTYASVVFAIIGLMAALGESDYAPGFILLAVVADFLDGKVARWTNKFNDFGLQLDSLADAISFGAVPAMFGIVLATPKDIVPVLTCTFFAICIITRLAWFNLQDPKAEKGVYYGLPSPLAALGAVLVPWYFNWNMAVTSAAFLIFGVLAVSAFKTSKKSLKAMLGPLGIIFS